MGSMNAVDIEREIEKKFILALRGIFEIDSTFVYNKEDKKSKLIITPDYPEKDTTFKTPHLVITGINYQFNIQNSLRGNYAGDIEDNGGRIVGERFLVPVPYSLNILCLAEYYESKDLANKIVNYVGFIANEVFTGLKLNISNVMKNSTSPKAQFPEKIFETPVSIQGHVEWQGRRFSSEYALNILQNININLTQ